MHLNEIFNNDNTLSEPILEAKMVWARVGKNVTRKYRCTVGNRKGRVVSNPSQCSKPIDLKKRFTLKRTKSRFGARMVRKSKKTKKMSAASRMVQRLNK